MTARRDVSALFLYALIFFFLFIQFPLTGTLAGNCDTWLGIALANTYLNDLKSLLFHFPAGRGMYPATDIHAFGETALIPASLYIFWKLWGLDDLLAHFLYITAIFSLTSFGIYLLVHQLTGNRPASLFAGFAFGCSNFMFANIDDSIVLFYFLPAISLTFFFKYTSEKKAMHLYLAAVAGGLQAYCSLYVFAYQCILLAVAVIFWWKTFCNARALKVFLTSVLMFCALAAPYFLYYLTAIKSQDFSGFNPTGHELAFFKLFALSKEHILSTLPLNILYGGQELARGDFRFFIDIRTRAFFGFLVLLLALIAFCKPTKQKFFFLAVGIIGLILSWGEITIGTHVIPPPIYYLFKIIPPVEHLRVVFRAYFLTSLAVAVLSGYGLAMLLSLRLLNSKAATLLATVTLMTFHALENIALPLPSFAAESYATVPDSYLQFFKDKQLSTVVDLPSSSKFLQFVDMDKDINPYNREFIYLNWQTQHRQNTVNGLNGYYPAARLEIQKAIDQFPQPGALIAAADFGIDYLVFHKNLLLQGEEDLLQQLTASPDLEILMQTDEMAIFGISKQMTNI